MKLPAVAMLMTAHGEPPAMSMPISSTSALKGTIVAAKNEPINRPQYPRSNNQSSSIVVAKLKIKNVK
jgi:hypothetical protein